MEWKIQQLADIEAIKQLKAEFFYADDDEDIDRLMTLFSKDAVVDLTEYGVPLLTNKEAIRAFFEGSYEATLMTRHMVTNPIIKVKGNKAKGWWYLLATVTYDGDPPRAVWSQGSWEDEYVREAGEWKIKKTFYHANFAADYGDRNGWVD